MLRGFFVVWAAFWPAEGAETEAGFDECVVVADVLPDFPVAADGLPGEEEVPMPAV
jgi:hypothetical protein